MSTQLFSLEGKAALVTGASRGIGRAIALAFAEAGADVAVAARTESDLETLVKEIETIGRKSIAVPTDVTDREQVQQMIERTVVELGGLDVLVNNAGGSRFMATLVDLRPEGWDKAISLNLDSVFHATQLAAQHMVSKGGGSIIQMSSVAGVQGAVTLSYYSAAKGGVRLFSQAAAKELAASNVRINCISPGWIATDLNVNMRESEDLNNFALSMIPMGRWGAVEDIVGAAIYLASDASVFMTGHTMVIDGGQTA